MLETRGYAIRCGLLAAACVSAPLFGGEPGGIVTEMTPERMREAIEKGGDPCYTLTRGMGLSTKQTHVGCFSTPYSRVAGAAKNAKVTYRSFTEADVTPEMIAPELWVLARPAHKPYGPGVADVRAVVIAPAKSKDRSGIIMPTRTTEDVAEYKNAMGATFEGRGLLAVFPLSVLTEENEVRVVYDARVCGSGGLSSKYSEECAVRFKLDKVR